MQFLTILIFSCRKISGFQIPCLRCTDAQFCSEKCLNEADETYHKYECAFYTRNTTNFFADFLKKFKGESGVFGYYQLLYKLLTKKKWNFFKTYHQEFVKNPNEKFAPENAKIGKSKTKPLTNPSEVNEENKECFYGGSYRGLFSLVRHSYDNTGCNIFWIILSAVFHLRTLQLTGYFGAEKRSYELTPDELLVAGVLVDILQLLRYNTHAIIEHFNVSEKGSFLARKFKYFNCSLILRMKVTPSYGNNGKIVQLVPQSTLR